MYKNRNTGTGNGMRGTRGMGKNVIFRGMSPNIPGNVAKHSGECPQTFRGMSSNIPGNVLKHSGEWPNIPGNVLKCSRECLSAALLLCASSVATRKIHLARRGIEPGPVRWDLAATATMLQSIGGFSKHIMLIFSWPYTKLCSMLYPLSSK